MKRMILGAVIWLFDCIGYTQIPKDVDSLIKGNYPIQSVDDINKGFMSIGIVASIILLWGLYDTLQKKRH